MDPNIDYEELSLGALVYLKKYGFKSIHMLTIGSGRITTAVRERLKEDKKEGLYKALYPEIVFHDMKITRQ